MSGLQIATDLSLPIEVVTDTTTLVARKGLGKTYLAGVIVEECVAAKVPTVVFDPMGHFSGLRSSADGKQEGLPVTILGGAYGDRPLDDLSGRAIAELVVEHPSWYVLDLSEMENWSRFAYEFMARIYTIKGPVDKRDTVLLVFDEAHQFAPQTQRQEGGFVPKMLGAAERLAAQGRGRGIGSLWCTQRPAKLNKNVLEQSGTLVAGQITGTNDRKALKEWVEGHGTEEEVKTFTASLGGLRKGEMWVYSPPEIFQRVKVRAKRTFDSSKTPEPGKVRVAPTKLASVNLDILDEKMVETIERSRVDDPEYLRGRIRELERACDEITQHTITVEAPAKEIEVSVLTDEDRALIEQLTQELMSVPTGLAAEESYTIGQLGEIKEQVDIGIAKLLGIHGDAESKVAKVVDQLDVVMERVAHPLMKVEPVTMTSPPGYVQAAGQRFPTETVLRSDLKKAERAFLWAIAGGAHTRTQIALAAMYAPKAGHVSNVFGELKRKGLIFVEGSDIAVTYQGAEIVREMGWQGPIPDRRLTITEVMTNWIEHSGRGWQKGHRDILRSILENRLPLTREQLGEATGYASGAGHFSNLLGKLTNLGLIEKHAGHYQISSEVMGLG